MGLELVCCTDVLIRDIRCKQLKQRNIAQTYALALRSSEEPDWLKVNLAIIERWSHSGLERIKKMAWSDKCFE